MRLTWGETRQICFLFTQEELRMIRDAGLFTEVIIRHENAVGLIVDDIVFETEAASAAELYQAMLSMVVSCR